LREVVELLRRVFGEMEGEEDTMREREGWDFCTDAVGDTSPKLEVHGHAEGV
jgi:hypothetical protein